MRLGNGTKLFNDLGFGTSMTSRDTRFINKDGSFNIVRSGRKKWHLYQLLIEMSWSRFIFYSTLFFIAVNLIFAVGFYLIGVDKLQAAPVNSKGGQFLESLFFSIQTFTTVGYGRLNPEGLWANGLSSVCALAGWMTLALMTGLFFARFSKPRPQILLSENAVITPYQGITSFQFRMANGRHHRIYDLETIVTMTWLEDRDGKLTRRFYQLPLERDRVSLFPLNWTIVHPIDAESPLWKKSPDELEAMRTEFLIVIKGYDESFNQIIHRTYSYLYNEVKWDHKFTMMYAHEDGTATRLFLDRLNETRKV